MSASDVMLDSTVRPAFNAIQNLTREGITGHPSMAELLESIVTWAVELLQADAGEIHLWDEDRQVLTQSFSCGFAKTFIGVNLKPGEGMAGRVFESGEPIIIDDYLSWEGRSPSYASAPPLTATLGVPMRWQDHTIGVLGIDVDARRRTFNQNDVRLALIFASVAAVAIENACLFERLQNQAEETKIALEQEVAKRTAELTHRARQLELNARVSREITSILDIDRLLVRVVELIREAFGYYHVHIYLVDKALNRLVLRASSGAMSPQRQCLEIESLSLNGAAAETNRSLLVNDVFQDPRFLFDERLPDTKSELVVPLRLGKRVVGTLDVQSDKTNAFSNDDVLVIQSLGDQVAVAIENARLYDRSRDLAVLEERNRLARELHDSVTQSLFSLDLHARAIATYLRRDPERAPEQVEHLRRTTREALTEMRSLIYDLRPASLDDLGLVPALRQQIERLARADEPEVVLHVAGERRLYADVEQGLFRIALEALRNAGKHAGAKKVTVALNIASDAVTLSITDDGRGFDPAALPTGRRAFGLIGMRERTNLLNGSLDIQSQPGSGTQVTVQVPA